MLNVENCAIRICSLKTAEGDEVNKWAHTLTGSDCFSLETFGGGAIGFFDLLRRNRKNAEPSRAIAPGKNAHITENNGNLDAWLWLEG